MAVVTSPCIIWVLDIVTKQDDYWPTEPCSTIAAAAAAAKMAVPPTAAPQQRNEVVDNVLQKPNTVEHRDQHD